MKKAKFTQKHKLGDRYPLLCNDWYIYTVIIGFLAYLFTLCGAGQ